MIIRLTKDFRKQYKKLDVRIQHSFDQRLEVFIKNPMDSSLKNHPLKDKWIGYRSIRVSTVTNDYRAIYKGELAEDGDLIISFVAIDTHDKLYR